MKITYIKLKNFIGIYAGTGKSEIEIDFKNGSNKIALLLGSNGSGKSTLLSTLHPFRETFDSRKSFVFKDKDAYKEVRLLNNNDEYTIKHFYGKSSNKNKSYIEKNGDELNENGNISSFNEILEKEFNLTKDYFTISKIGSNVSGFIGLSTANRKDYINKFVPNIDEYLNAFDTVNEKHKELNKDIKQLKKNIEKIDKESLLLDKADRELNLKMYNKELGEKEKSIMQLELELDDAKESLGEVPTNIEDLYKQALNDKKNDDLEYSKYIDKYPKLLEYNLDSIKDKITEMDKNLAVLQLELKTKLKDKDSLDNKLTSASINKIKFDNLKSDLEKGFISTKEIKTDIANKEMELNKLKNKIENKKELFTLNIDPLDENYSFNHRKEKGLQIIDEIQKTKDNVDYNIISFTMSSRLSKIQEVRMNYNNLEKQLNTLSSDIDNIEREIAIIEKEKVKNEEIYNAKPENCNDSSCSFIKEAINFVNNELPKLAILESTKDEKSKQYHDISNEFSYAEQKLEYLENIKKIYEKINDLSVEYLYDNIEGDTNIDKFDTFILEFDNRSESIKELLNIGSNINELTNNYNSIMTSIQSLKELLNINEVKEERLKEYQDTIDESIKIIEENEPILDKLILEIDDINNSINRKKSTMILMSKFESIFTTHNEVTDKYNELKEIYESNLSTINKINDTENKISLLNEDIDDLKIMISSVVEDLDNIKNKLFLFKTYQDKLEEIEGLITDISIVKDALDPKKGIPLVFMKNFLDIVGSKANDLLDKAYNGSFKIKFEINSKEFLIKVYKSDGTVLHDISEASQGEVSLTTIALSLSMIENLLKDCEYNVLYLDEIDATLSTANRRAFLDLLEIQLENNIEQCFVISHNDEFYSKDIDLVLFNGNNLDKENIEIMEGKTVLFDVEN